MSPPEQGKGTARWLAYGLALLLAAFACAAPAAQERYDYDALGRLIRVIDEQARVTEYVYDAAGNLLQVTTGAGGAQAPVVNSISPATIRRNQVRTVQITGTGLTGVTVSNPDPGIGIGNLSVSPTVVSFTLTVSATAQLGTQAFTLANAAGSAQATLTVAPPIVYTVTPNPLAIPPDNVARQFRIEASEADTEPVIFSASTLNPAVAVAGSSPITLPAGQTQATGTITGIAAGTTVLRLSAQSFVEPLDFVVNVTTEFASANVLFTRPLGLVKGDPTAPAANSPSGPVLSAPLGVVRGDPSSPAANSPSGPVLTAPVGVIKGDPTSPEADSPSGPVLTVPLGVVKGDPTSPPAGATAGPVVSPAVGVDKP